MWLDYVRFIAILLVVFTHVHEQIGVDSYIVRSIFYHIDRLGVPLFFMLTGSLVLPKAASQNILTFYKKRIFQFIFLLFIYSVLTKLVEMLCNGYGFKEAIITSFKFFNAIVPNQIGAGHLWFMYAIIGLYLIAPFIGRFLNSLTNREILIFLLLSITFTQLKSTLQGGFNVRPNILYSIGSDFLGAYLNFFIIGYLFVYRKVKLGLFISVILFILPILVALLREIHKESFIDTFHWYSVSLSILLSSIGLLGITKYFFETAKNNIYVENISKFSFGIYLSHYLFIYIFKNIIDFSCFDFSMKLVFLFIPSLVCSYLFTWLLSKNKITRRLVM